MPWPDFIIIGAQRCGTTSLYDYLGQHPDIYTCPSKEPHYFCADDLAGGLRGPQGDGFWKNRITDTAGYTALFKDKQHRMSGEASTLYLYFSDSAKRIYEQIPGVKLIVILRNPVERAFSEFMHNCKLGYEPLDDFGAALADEERRKEQWGFVWDYTGKSRYAEQLKRYLELFPRDNIHTVVFEDFTQNPVNVTQAIYSFLGVDKCYVPDIAKVHHLSGTWRNPLLKLLLDSPLSRKLPRGILPARLKTYGRKLKQKSIEKPEMHRKVREMLLKAFRADTMSLAQLIDIHPDRWLR